MQQKRRNVAQAPRKDINNTPIPTMARVSLAGVQVAGTKAINSTCTFARLSCTYCSAWKIRTKSSYQSPSAVLKLVLYSC